MTTPSDKVNFTLQLPNTLLEAFKRVAEAEDRSVAGELRRLIRLRVIEHTRRRS